MIYEVENGKLVEVRGNKDEPMTRGTLCVKLKDYHDHHYNPDRVQQPLRRVGPKGSRRFERISWDDAIAEISARWKDIIATYGSQASCRTPISAMRGWCRGSPQATPSSTSSARL
jgi:anaerobic selenocysteine-containing dehydrogenase